MPPPPHTPLTPGEKRLLQALVDHGTTEAAARARGIRLKTFRNQAASIHAKIGCQTNTEMIVWALRSGHAILSNPATENLSERAPRDTGQDPGSPASSQGHGQ